MSPPKSVFTARRRRFSLKGWIGTEISRFSSRVGLAREEMTGLTCAEEELIQVGTAAASFALLFPPSIRFSVCLSVCLPMASQ